MGVSWTTEQQQVIDLRNRNILVSAAAGSGKDCCFSRADRENHNRQKSSGRH